MNRKEIKNVLENMAVGESTDIEDLTYAVRTSRETWSICDNGEEVAGLSMEAAVEIAAENLECNVEDREQQVNRLHEMHDVILWYDLSESTAEEAVAYYESQVDMPEWYDDHDRNLLIGLVKESIG